MTVVIFIFFLLVPVFSFPYLIYGMIKYPDKRYLCALGIAFILAIIAYYIVPSWDLDMYRYYEIIDIYRSISISEYISNYFFLLEPLFNITLFLGSKIFSNSFIFFLYCFSGYAILYYLIFDYGKMKNLNTKQQMLAFAIVNCLFIYLHFAHGIIRNIYGILILSLAFYFEFIKGKKKIWYKFLYVIPIFFHMSLLVGIVLRVLLQFDFKKIRGPYFLCMILLMFSPNIIKFGAGILSHVPFFHDMLAKVIMHVSQPANIFGPYYFFKMSATILLFVLLLKQKERLTEPYYQMVFYMILCTIFSVTYEIFFTRFCVMTVIFSIPILINYIKKYSSTKQFVHFLIPCGIICVAFLYLQVDLFFDLNYGNLFINKSYHNIFSIFFK